MPRPEKQKAKTLMVAKYLWERTDESHGVTAAEIVDYLEDEYGIVAEEHSIYRDIAALRDEFGMDIDGGRGKKYRLVSRDLDYDDLRTLAECVYATRFITENQAARIVQALGAFCSDYQKEALEGETFVGNRTRTEERSVLLNASEIRNAIRNKRKISFQYSTATIDNVQKTVFRKNGQRFIVSPYCLLVNEGNLYLLSCTDWGEIFTHRVDRMRNVRLSTLSRIGQSEFDKLGIQNYLRRTFGMFKGDRQRVTMAFENGLLDAVVDRLGTENILYYPDDKKHFSVNAEIEVSPQFFAWIFGFGDKARIKTPLPVVEEMKKYLNTVSAVYEEKDAGK